MLLTLKASHLNFVNIYYLLYYFVWYKVQHKISGGFYHVWTQPKYKYACLRFKEWAYWVHCLTTLMLDMNKFDIYAHTCCIRRICTDICMIFFGFLKRKKNSVIYIYPYNLPDSTHSRLWPTSSHTQLPSSDVGSALHKSLTAVSPGGYPEPACCYSCFLSCSDDLRLGCYKDYMILAVSLWS